MDGTKVAQVGFEPTNTDVRGREDDQASALRNIAEAGFEPAHVGFQGR